MNARRAARWLKRMLVAFAVLVLVVLFVLLPLGGSFLITNSHFRYPERGPKTPEAVNLKVENVDFQSADGIHLHGWWSSGDPDKPVIIFGHGLNRSRLELLERGAEANHRGYSVLLFDLRNHGESDRAYITLGINEKQDVCAASRFVSQHAPGREQVLWGVSMGASTEILAARACPGFKAIVADSSFLSFRETVAHHLNLIFRLPPFPIANLIVFITELRTHINADNGDVESAVRSLPGVPILFIAGGADKRMPPVVEQRLRDASSNPQSKLIVIPGATHGEAYNTDKKLYLSTVFEFLSATTGHRSNLSAEK